MVSIEGKKVLVVDDAATIRTGAESYLKQYGVEVFHAENGYEAISILDSVKPDLILMDIMMPVLDGYQASVLIKNNPDFKHIKIVMLSSKDGVFDVARGKMSGADGYITKPFTMDELIRGISGFLG